MSNETTRHGKTVAERMVENDHSVSDMNIMLSDISECLGSAGHFLQFLWLANDVDRTTTNGADFVVMIQRIHKLSCMILEDEI